MRIFVGRKSTKFSKFIKIDLDKKVRRITKNLKHEMVTKCLFQQFGGKPVECLTPDIFSGSWEEVFFSLACQKFWLTNVKTFSMPKIIAGRR